MSIRHRAQLEAIPEYGFYLVEALKDLDQRIAGRLSFPETIAADSRARVLDDYRESPPYWRPTFLGSGGQSGQIYSQQFGQYIKIGRLVAVMGHVKLSALGTITGSVLIGGLPFPTGPGNSGSGGWSVGWFGGWTTNIVNLFLQWDTSAAIATSVQVFQLTAAAAQPTAVVQGDLSATSQIRFSGLYMSAQ